MSRRQVSAQLFDSSLFICFTSEGVSTTLSNCHLFKDLIEIEEMTAAQTAATATTTTTTKAPIKQVTRFNLLKQARNLKGKQEEEEEDT